MAPPIKDVATQFTQVGIRGLKYVATISLNSNIITRDCDSLKFSDVALNANEEIKSINLTIVFDTPTGNLSDLQFAVQENGYIWVKAPGYKLIKIPPEYVDLATKVVSKEGIIYLKANSVTE